MLKRVTMSMECAKWRDNAGVLYCVTVCCSVLQCVAACCSVLQRIAMSVQNGVIMRQEFMCAVLCCSVLQCVAVCFNEYGVCKMA